MRRGTRRRWVVGSVGAALMAFASWMGGGAQALAQGDADADAPDGFTDVMNATRGVIVQVPINARGEENTNAAKMRFFQEDTQVTKSTDARGVWRRSVDPGNSAAVRGMNLPHRTVGPTGRDSSTWGWYNWYGYGWAQPYYYSWWYPTFYWNSYYWQYNYYWSWYYPGYAYYYYYWWW